MSNDNTQQEIASQVEAEKIQATPEKREKKRGSYFTASRIASIATFTAIAIVCKLIGKTLMLTPSFTVSFIYLPWLIAGAYLGPLAGMTVGLVSDVLGNMVFGTALNPLTMVSNTLFPLPIALIFKFFKRGNVYIKTICGAVISLFICTLGIGSLALYLYYYSVDYSFFEYVYIYRLPQVGVLAVNIVALCLLVSPLQKAKLYPVSDKSKYDALIFGLGLIIAYALFAAALITVTVNKLGNIPTYIILSAIYVLLNLFLVSSRVHGKVKTVLILCELLAVIVAVIAAFDVSITEIWLKYILSAAAAAITLALGIIVVVLRTRRARRK